MKLKENIIDQEFFIGHSFQSTINFISLWSEKTYIYIYKDACGVIVTVGGNWLSGQSSKSWTRLFASHIAQIAMEKVWILLLTLQ